jgi:hypothetical protein
MKNFDMRPDSYVLNIEKASIELSMLTALVERLAITNGFLRFSSSRISGRGIPSTTRPAARDF